MPREAPPRSPARAHLLPAAVLLVVLVFHAAGTLVWVRAASLPDGLQNEFIHLQRVVELHFRARDLGGDGLHGLLWQDYYPPLLTLVGELALVVGPNHEDTLAASNLVWLALLLIATFGIGRRIGGRGATGIRASGARVGALAAALVSLYPAIYGNLRHFEPNVALAALATAALWALLASRGLTRAGPSVGFGLALAAGLLVDRLAMAPLLAVPTAAAITAAWVRPGAVGAAPGSRAASLRGVAIVAVLVAALCGYFYLQFARLHAGEIAGQLGGEVDASGVLTEHRSPWSPWSWGYYLFAWIDVQMGLPLALAALVALGAAVIRARRDRDGWLVTAWLVGGLLLFSLVGKKQPYYTLPLLPGAALLTARAVVGLRPPALAGAVAATLLALGLAQWSALSFARPEPPERGPVGWVLGRSPLPDDALGPRYPQARPPKRLGLRFDEALDAIRADGFDADADRVAVFGDVGEFYEGYLVPMTRLGLDTFEVDGVLLFPPVVRDRAAETDYFVFVTADAEARWPTEAHVRRTFEEFLPPYTRDPGLLAALEAMGARATEIGAFEQGTGQTMYVYRLGPPAAAEGAAGDAAEGAAP